MWRYSLRTDANRTTPLAPTHSQVPQAINFAKGGGIVRPTGPPQTQVQSCGGRVYLRRGAQPSPMVQPSPVPQPVVPAVIIPPLPMICNKCIEHEEKIKESQSIIERQQALVERQQSLIEEQRQAERQAEEQRKLVKPPPIPFKRALIIGINYYGRGEEMSTNIVNAYDMYQLCERFAYDEICVLYDLQIGAALAPKDDFDIIDHGDRIEHGNSDGSDNDDFENVTPAIARALSFGAKAKSINTWPGIAPPPESPTGSLLPTRENITEALQWLKAADQAFLYFAGLSSPGNAVRGSSIFPSDYVINGEITDDVIVNDLSDCPKVRMIFDCKCSNYFMSMRNVVTDIGGADDIGDKVYKMIIRSDVINAVNDATNEVEYVNSDGETTATPRAILRPDNIVSALINNDSDILALYPLSSQITGYDNGMTHCLAKIFYDYDIRRDALTLLSDLKQSLYAAGYYMTVCMASKNKIMPNVMFDM